MNATSQTDEALLARFAQRGDRDAAALLVERHRDAVYDLAFRVLRREADAADATQGTFLQALRAAARFRGDAKFRTWLFRIAWNESLKVQARTQRRERMETPIDHDDLAAPSPSASSRELASALAREVDRLPEPERQTVILCYQRGLEYREAAAILGCAVGTVGSRLSAARDRLRARLAPLGALAVVDLESALRASPSHAAPASLTPRLAEIAATAKPALSMAKLALVAALPAAAAVVTAAIVVANSGSGEPAIAAALPGGHERLVAAAMEPPAVAATAATRAAVRPEPSERATPVAAPDRNPVRLVFTGRVIDAAERTGLKNEVVRFQQLWPPPPVLQKKVPLDDLTDAARTDEAGSYRLEVTVPSGAVGRLAVSSFSRVSTPRVVEAKEPREERIEFETSSGEWTDAERAARPFQRALVDALRRAAARDHAAALSGTVLREAGGEVPGVVLRVYSPDGSLVIHEAVEAVDADTGAFFIGPLPAGALKVEAFAQGLGHSVLPAVEVRDGEIASGLVVTLRRGEAPLSGVVVDSRGNGVADATVSAYTDALEQHSGWVPETAAAKTDAAGRFRLDRCGVAGAGLRVFVNATGFRRAERSEVAGHEEVRIALTRVARVRGRVVMKSGEKLPDFFFVSVRSERPAVPSKGMSQQLDTGGAVIDPRTGEFSAEVDELGPVRLEIELLGRRPVVREHLEVGEDGFDVGVIEIDAKPQ